MTRPRLALCMIVRDAEDYLPALLESVKGAFDEYVFVDTGSNDATRDILLTFAAEEGERMPSALDWTYGEADAIGARVKLLNFEWVDDFAVARNYSFEQATAQWRMYLDSDDVFPGAHNLRSYIEGVEERNADVNAISMAYQYAKGHSEQDKIRVVRWFEPDGSPVGWRWEDELHEYQTCAPRPRMISKAAGYKVLHAKRFEDYEKAADRNRPIMRKAYENATGEKRGRFAYHMAQDCKLNEDWEALLHYMREVVHEIPGTNLAAYALIEMSRACLFEMGLVEKGLGYAAVLVTQMPEYREGFFLNAIALLMRGDVGHACMVFDDARRRPRQALESVQEVWFSDGLALAYAAEAYLRAGRYDDARAVLREVHEHAAQHNQVASRLAGINQRLLQDEGLDIVRKLVSFYLADADGLKALDFLQQHVPTALGTHPLIPQLYNTVRAKVAHVLDGDQAYADAYGSIPEQDFHTAPEHREGVRGLARAQRVVAWAQSLPKEGPPIVVGSIGFQDGIIEEAMLEQNERLRLVVCDVGQQANQGFRDLDARFPGRVQRHEMTSTYDWGAQWNAYDAVLLFEVIEHVPDASLALTAIADFLRPEGTLFLSTPIASRWIEPHQADEPRAWHVRAYNHVSLFYELSAWFRVDALREEYDGTFVVQCSRHGALPQGGALARERRVAIFVPGTPKPFDALSHLDGFVGGSEECVIHLARELARGSAQVAVFAPTHTVEGSTLRAYDNVLWRDSSEFNPDADGAFDAVLYWRCPDLLPAHNKHRKLLWLHDAWYCPQHGAYERADAVLTLSASHERSLREVDRLPAIPVVRVGNGIDPEAFPPLDGERNPHRVIYASSPDRGLARLLAVWEDVQNAVPDAELHIYYDWTVFEREHPADAEALRAQMRALGDRVVFHGGVSHGDLHDAFRRAGVWAYPTKGPIETFCITAVKAMACGLVPVIPDAGALHEVTGAAFSHLVVTPRVNDSTIDTPQGLALFKDALIDTLKRSTLEAERAALREYALSKHAWPRVAERFIGVIYGNQEQDPSHVQTVGRAQDALQA